MTTYSAITSGQIDADSPFDVTLAQQYRDNPIAITEAAAGAPEMVAATGASWKLLQTQTASASTSIDFTTNIDSTYKEYAVIITECIPTSDGDSLRIKISKDTGSTWEAGALYRYMEKRFTDIPAEGTTSNTGTSLFQVLLNMGSASGEGAGGILYFSSPASTTVYKKFLGDFTTISSAADTVRSVFTAAHKQLTAYDGIQFFCGTSTIASGEFRLYGIRRT